MQGINRMKDGNQSRRLLTVGGLAMLTTSLVFSLVAPAVSANAATKKYTIGLLIPQGDQYFQSVVTGLKSAVKKDGGKVIVVNTNNDAGQEAQAVQNLLSRKVDAIMMQPATSTAGSIATMKSVRKAKTILICYGNCSGDTASPAIVNGVVQSDNTALGTGTGVAAAAYIKSNLGGTAVIGILNCDSFDVCKLRKSGFKEALSAAGVKATYVADQEGYLVDKATPIAANMLSGDPTINLMWSANEGGTAGIVAAVTASGKKIPVFGTDISVQLAELLQDPANILQASTGQDGFGTAVKAYALAKNALQGKKNSPLEVGVKGATYSRTAPAEITKYLGK